MRTFTKTVTYFKQYFGRWTEHFIYSPNREQPTYKKTWSQGRTGYIILVLFQHRNNKVPQHE